MLLCQMTRRGLGALELLWNPDRSGVISQANGPAFEVLGADPAQIRPSSMSCTGLSDASVDTSEGAGMNSGMPLMC